MSTQIITAEQETQAFELVQRQAKLLAASTLVPKDFQGNMGNCAIALNIARRLGADGFMVIQNLDVIHGRPSFRGKFLIAMINASGRFSPLKFRFDGEGDDYGCTAYATDKATGDTIEGPKVNWKMVKGEGWLGKQGSKWKTMPDLMFRYRSGAYFANIYAPDITLGMMTTEEAADIAPIRDVTPRTPKFIAPEGNQFESAPGDNDPEPEAIDATAENAEEERRDLWDGIRETYEAAEMSQSQCEAKARKLLKESPTWGFGTATLDQMREIHERRGELAGGGAK